MLKKACVVQLKEGCKDGQQNSCLWVGCHFVVYYGATLPDSFRVQKPRQLRQP